jgi:RNA recognition motif-containing protein
MRIVIENLPRDATEDSVYEALGPFAELGRITIVRQCKEPLAVVVVNMTRIQAQAFVSRIDERIYHGHRLHAWVPLWDDEQVLESSRT